MVIQIMQLKIKKNCENFQNKFLASVQTTAGFGLLLALDSLRHVMQPKNREISCSMRKHRQYMENALSCLSCFASEIMCLWKKF